jgi:hypothetical protein
MVEIMVKEDVAAFHRGPYVIQRALDEINFMVAGQTLAEVHLILDRSIRNPTPYYETQLIVEPEAGGYVVHDRGIVYGPWLEGTSTRNRTTRFKGYHAFRQARQIMERKTQAILQREVIRIIRGLQ